MQMSSKVDVFWRADEDGELFQQEAAFCMED